MLAGKLSLVAGYHSSRIMPICPEDEARAYLSQHHCCGANLGMGIPPGSLLLRNDRVEVNCRPDWKIASMFNPALSLVDVHAPGGE